MTTPQLLILLAGIACIVYGPKLAALIGPRLLPLVAGAVTRAGSLDPRWWSFGKGVILTAVLMLFAGKVEIPWQDWFKPGPPTPDVVPDVKGLHRVLFLRETGANITKEQQYTLDSTKIVGYLNDKCPKVNGRAEWRRWDQNIDAANESKGWQLMLEGVKTKAPTLPVVAVETDRGITIYPIATEADTLALLQKVGG